MVRGGLSDQIGVARQFCVRFAAVPAAAGGGGSGPVPNRTSRHALVVLTLASAFVGSVAPVSLAASRAPDARPRIAPEHPGRSLTRPERAEHRGHVRVDRLPSAAAGETDGGPMGPGAGGHAPRTPGSARASASLYPISPATTNGTTPPTLTKLPVTTGFTNIPNPVVAAGPDHVAWSDRGMLTITNRSGGGLTTVSFLDFFLLPNGTYHDEGQIYYDAAHGRWVAIEISRDCVPGGGAVYGHGYLDFAVSDSANPRGGWQLYGYTYNDQLVWDPGYGSSANQIVLTSRFEDMGAADCSSAGAISWDVTGITWADLTAGTFHESYFLFAPDDEAFVFDMQPAVSQGGSDTTLDVIVDYAVLDPAHQEQWLLRVDGIGSGATGQLYPLPADPFGFPQFIPQPQSGFTPYYGPSGAVVINDRLVTSLTQPCRPAGDTVDRNCVRVIDLDTSQPVLAPNQDFAIGNNGIDTFSPGLAIANNGDLVITFQQAASAAGPTSYVVRQAPTDAENTITGKRTLVTPTGGYEQMNGAELIGLQPDPLVPDAVWVINQAGGTIDLDYAYRLQVAQARSATGDTYSPIDPLRVLDTRTATGPTGPFANGVPRKFAVAGAGRRGDPGRRGRDHRQPDRDRPGIGRVCLGRAVGLGQPGDLDDQLPARRQPGQQPDPAARRPGQADGRLQGRRRQVDAADPRRDRLLHRRRRRRDVPAAHRRPGPRHPDRDRAQRQVRDGRAQDVPGDRPRRRPGRGDRGHRQPDRSSARPGAATSA
jgi:hypothetical protein